MSARWDRILDRLWLTLGAAALILGTLYLGAAVGVRRWSYTVEDTSVVTPGGLFRMGRRTGYDDRALFHGRRLQGLVPGIEAHRPPIDFGGAAWSVDTPISGDFSSGSAAPIDSPSAACDGFQRLFQRRPAPATPSTVACAGR